MKPKSWWVIACACLLGLLLCECVARLMLDGGLPGAARERAALLERIPGEQEGAPGAPTAARFALHPYFAYTYEVGKETNNLGFPNPEAGYPYQKQPHEFVVGLFGGSVAVEVGYNSKWIVADRLRPILAKKGYQRVTVLSFAGISWRQPQQFIAMMLAALPAVDLAIDLEGFNELRFLDDSSLRSRPSYFPDPFIYGLLARSVSGAGDALPRATAIVANHEAAESTRRFDSAPLRWSALAHLWWRLKMKRYLAAAQKLRSEEEQAVLSAWSKLEPAGSDAEVAQRRSAYFDLWAELLRASHQVLRARHKKLFVFLQPNQHVAGSKPTMSDAERAAAKPDAAEFAYLTPLYRRAEKMFETLEAEGLETRSLVSLFAREPAQVYSDECCHFNQRGSDALARAMADRIVATGALDGP